MWFHHKYLADDALSRYKARLVVNGSTQLEGVDVDETFSPVVKLGTIWIILSLATSRHWHVHQLDVKKAFLHEGVFLEERGEECGFDSKEDEVVSKVEDISLVDGVFDGALGEGMFLEEGGEECGFDSKEDEMVPKVEDVSLVDGVFDGALGGYGDEDFAIGEGV
ncbi:ribonuclease H-like domain-containing protein [Tanacetum coccineum]